MRHSEMPHSEMPHSEMPYSEMPYGEATYHLLGVPLRSGSQYPGSENDAQAYRDAHIQQRLEAVGCRVVDEGDVPVPSYLPHHNIAPIKNWPGPRIVWDCVEDHVSPYLQEPGHVPLLIGTDCSVVVGTVQALRRARGDNVYVIYLDGDIDAVAPVPDRCMSAAGMGIWLMTQPSPFRPWPALDPSHVTVLGWHNDLGSARIDGLDLLSLAEVRQLSPVKAAERTLRAVPDDAHIVVHLDIDVLSQQEMPAAYFPHRDGLTIPEYRQLLEAILPDPRVALIEVAEYASLRDLDQRHISTVIDLLVDGLTAGRQRTPP
jgi:arginase